MRPHGLLIALLLPPLLLAATACDRLPIGLTPIAELLQNPAQYEGRTVKVSGIVREVTKLPFLPTSLYSLEQEGASLIVATSQGPPALNTHLVVIGTAQNLALIGERSVGVHLRENRRFLRKFF
ncbi:MAG: hypothetical protein D6773_18940 [Alphaproteobacteria bacterium]|nr:MAG: hypothetical protein D6773_18940 [Alphaproteobacteria bacterium]